MIIDYSIFLKSLFIILFIIILYTILYFFSKSNLYYFYIKDRLPLLFTYLILIIITTFIVIYIYISSSLYFNHDTSLEHTIDLLNKNYIQNKQKKDKTLTYNQKIKYKPKNTPKLNYYNILFYIISIIVIISIIIITFIYYNIFS